MKNETVLLFHRQIADFKLNFEYLFIIYLIFMFDIYTLLQALTC